MHAHIQPGRRREDRSSKVPPGRVAAIQNSLFKHLDPKTQAPHPNIYDEMIDDNIYTPDYDDTLTENPVMPRSGFPSHKPSMSSSVDSGVVSAQGSEVSSVALQGSGFSRMDSGTSPQEPGIGMIHVSAMPRPSLPTLSSHASRPTRTHTSTGGHNTLSEAETQTPDFKDSESGCCSRRSSCRCASGCGACFTKERWWRLRWLTLGVIVGLIIGIVAGITCTYLFAGKIIHYLVLINTLLYIFA